MISISLGDIARGYLSLPVRLRWRVAEDLGHPTSEIGTDAGDLEFFRATAAAGRHAELAHSIHMRAQEVAP